MKKFSTLSLFVSFSFSCLMAQLPSPGLVGYWHNWNTSSAPYIQLDQVDSRYNIVDLAFAVPRTGTDYDMVFTPSMVTEATLKTQIQTLQSQGRKVIISIGGANDPVVLNNTAERDQFVLSMGTIITNYGFDGIDIDLEGSSISVTSGTTIANPTDVTIVNMIDAIKAILLNYKNATGKKLLLTMAPETAFVQGGMSAYGGVWGAYLPVIHALRDQIDLLHVQLYNSGTMYGIDGKIYSVGTPDFIVAMSEAVIKGFNTAGGFFTGLAAEKVAVGLPACSQAAGSGYMTPSLVQSGMNYLLGKGAKPGSYTLQQTGGYPSLGGMMTWSVNWDKSTSCGTAYEFAQNFETIFSGFGCATPTGLAASNVLATSASLSWNTQSAASAYTIQYRSSLETVFTEAGSSVNSLSLTGLTAGMNYIAAVRSTCSTGNSSYSASIQFATSPDPSCGAPTAPVVSAVEPTSAVISWNAISGATGYIVRFKPQASASFTEVVAAGSPYTLTSLAASTGYEVSVKAVCSAGGGAFSTSSTFSTLAPYACTSPSAPAFSGIQSSSAVASWRSVKGATAYVYRYRTVGSLEYNQVTLTSTSYTMTGLAAGTGYSGSVRVLCRNGQSAFSSEVSFSTTGGASCPTPATPVVSGIGDNGATVSWSAVTGAQSYVLRYRSASSSSYTEVPVSGTTHTLSGLTAGTSYVAGVRAICTGSVYGGYSTDAGFITTGGGGGGTCPVPSGLTITNVTANAATAGWSAVNGAEAYEFLYHIKGSLAYWTNKVVTLPSFAMSGLKAGTLYETKVRARCPGNVWSNMSANIEFTTRTKAGNVSADIAGPARESISYGIVPTVTGSRIQVIGGEMTSVSRPYSIFSVQGALMRKGQVTPYAWIDVESFPSGIYLLHYEGKAFKFIVNK